MHLITLCVSVVIFFCLSVTAKFGPDKSVCDLGQFVARAKNYAGPAIPMLPRQYTVRIEADIIDSNNTIDMHEYFDGLENKGAVHMWEGGQEQDLIFLYATNEMIVLDYDTAGSPPRCHVDDLAKSTQKRIFGLTTGPNGNEHMFSANQALKFGADNQVYIGRAEARDGIIVDAWESCTYMDSLDTTVHITWFFTAPGWQSPENIVSPVEADVYAVTHINSSFSVQSIRKYYLSDFKPWLFDGPVQAFQTPAGTYCPDRVSLRAMPNVAKMFSFSAEIIEPYSNYVNWIQEYYDWNLNLTRYDYTPDPNSGLPTRLLTRVHDFNTGIAYNIDPNAGNCTMSAISSLGLDAKAIDASTLRIRTPKEFFYMDKTKYQYAGQRQVRGMACDVFGGIRHDYPAGTNTTTLWEWYFASQDWMDYSGYQMMFYLPVMLQISSRDPSTPLNFIYNIYDYSESQPNIYKTDVSACFNASQRQDYHLTFSGADKGNVTADPDGFKAAVVQSVAQFASISPLRVDGVQVDYVGTSIAMSFTVLDSPPLPGDVKTTKTIVSLSSAVSTLNDLISEGAFVVTLPNFEKLTVIPALERFGKIAGNSGKNDLSKTFQNWKGGIAVCKQTID